MKIIANHYRANEIFRMIRENSGKTQEEFGKLIGKSRNIMNMDKEILISNYYWKLLKRKN